MREINVLCSFLVLMEALPEMEVSVGVFYLCSFSPVARFVGCICKQDWPNGKQSGDSEEVVLFLMKKV